MEPKRGKNSLFGELTPEKKSGLVYSATAVSLVLVSFLFQIVLSVAGASVGEDPKPDWYLYCSFLLPQLGFSAIVVVYFVRTKEPVRSVAGKCSPKYFLLAVVLQIGLLSLSELNSLFLDFLGRFGYRSEINLPSLDGAGLFGVLFVVALLPALLEETVFRGLLLKGLKGFGEVFVVLVCGALFSLYHQNPAQTVYQFFCGAAFAWATLRAGSVLPTVLSHFLNNAFVIFVQKFWNGILPKGVEIPLLVVSVICLVGSLVYLMFFDKDRKRESTTEEKGSKRDFFLFAAAGILLFAILWIGSLVAGLRG